jgi:catechol 2,3-dioxygenase-like lactoylglutathione lyase family enzyme
VEDKKAQTPKEMFGKFVQIGVVVADLDKSTRALTDIFGIGPFHIVDWPPEGRADLERFYHGQPGDFTARMAFTELGSIELELIQPVSGQSIWADFLRDSGGGIHHIRFNVDELEPVQEYLAGQGILSAQHGSGIRPGTMWMNFNSMEKVGFIIEVMKVVPGTSGRTPRIVDGNVIG